MEFKQRTIPEIIESEKLMVQTASDRYGAHYTNAFECSFFLSKFIKSVDASRSIFAMFLSQVKKYHMLALFSTVRLHQVQWDIKISGKRSRPVPAPPMQLHTSIPQTSLKRMRAGFSILPRSLRRSATRGSIKTTLITHSN